MPNDVVVKLAEEHQQKAKEEILALLDAEVERFSSYVAGLPGPAGAPLSNPERALVKTYLVAKIREKL